jgi:Arc/MetJ-type ribon-helix-helix transcriptional regulator
VKKTTIYLDDADDAQLREATARRGWSRSDLTREAVRALLSDETALPRRPRPLGSSGHHDTSERVDDLLAAGFGR